MTQLEIGKRLNYRTYFGAVQFPFPRTHREDFNPDNPLLTRPFNLVTYAPTTGVSYAPPTAAATPVMGVDGPIEPAHVCFIDGDVVGSHDIYKPFGIGDNPVVFWQPLGQILVVRVDVAENTEAPKILFTPVGVELDQAPKVSYFPLPQTQVVSGEGPAGGEWIIHGVYFTPSGGVEIGSYTTKSF